MSVKEKTNSMQEAYFRTKSFKSEKTKNNYIIAINNLHEEFGDSLEEMDAAKLNNFLTGKFQKYTSGDTEHAYSNKTIEIKTSIIHAYLKKLYEIGLIDTDYSSMVTMIKQDRTIVQEDIPSGEELKAIVDYFRIRKNEEPGNYYVLRDNVLFNLVLHSGFSTTQLSTLTEGSISVNQEGPYAIVHKPKYTEIPISIEDKNLIDKLVGAKINYNLSTDALFISEKKKNIMSRRSINYRIHKICEESGLSKAYSPEKIKIAGVQAALIKGFPPEKAAELLGVDAKYFYRRMQPVTDPKKARSYADLFKGDD